MTSSRTLRSSATSFGLDTKIRMMRANSSVIELSGERLRKSYPRRKLFSVTNIIMFAAEIVVRKNFRCPSSRNSGRAALGAILPEGGKERYAEHHAHKARQTARDYRKTVGGKRRHIPGSRITEKRTAQIADHFDA